MQPFVRAFFLDGPMSKVLDVVIAAQESDGNAAVEDEILRFMRVSHYAGNPEWGPSSHTIPALLDFVAEALSVEALSNVPGEFWEKLGRAAGEASPEDYLRTLAGIMRILMKEGVPEYTQLPMVPWEARATFPMLRGFGANWIEPADFETFSDAIRVGIESEHPFCREFLAPVAAEAQRALVIFPGGLPAGTAEQLPWVSPESLHELARLIDRHMSDSHSADR